jgi:hypothetical protein
MKDDITLTDGGGKLAGPERFAERFAGRIPPTDAINTPR